MTFPRSRFIIVTGTDTGVGKTVTTAALAVLLESRGMSVAVVKPVQTGLGTGEPSDVEEINRLTGVTDVHEFSRLRDPLAPESAALLEGVVLPTVAELTTRIRTIVVDVVLIEGAGGLLVRIDLDGGTMLDAALSLSADVVVVGREGLGTLNHTQLTVDRLRAVGIQPHLILGCCAAEPGLAEKHNHADLPRITGLPIEGRIPEGAGALSSEEFRAQAPAWFSFR